MDLHVRIGCAGFLIASALLHPAAGTAAETDSTAAAALWDLQGEDALDLETDPALVAALDALLADPADLASGEARRLAILPWLGAGQLESLERAGPIGSLAEIASLPGWSAEAARSLAPFVRNAGRRRPIRTTLHATRTAVSFAARTPGLELAARRPHTGREPAGSVGFSGAGLEVVGGDFRTAWAQGALLWSASGGPRLGEASVRAPRSLVPVGDPRAGHALRGLGAQVQRGDFRALLVGAQSTAGPVRAAGLAGPLRGGRWSVLGMRVGEVRGTSLGYEVLRPDRRLALELALAPRTAPAAQAGAEWRLASLTLGARLGVSPTGPPSPLATGLRAASTRYGLLQVRTSRRRLHLALALLRAADTYAEGRNATRDDQELTLSTTRAGTALELRLRRTITTTEGWQSEACRDLERRERSRARLRVRRSLSQRWIVCGELQRASTVGSVSPAVRGEEWGVRCERIAGALRPFVGAALHRIPDGIDLSTPVPGSALGTIALHGDALQLLVGARVVRGILDAAAAAWITSSPAGGLRAGVRGGLVLCMPSGRPV